MNNIYDFSGYATKNDLLCSDGRIIRRDAFKVNNGARVPLVWQHNHDDPNNVLGHAVLENRGDGVYAYCHLNNTDSGKQTKELIRHGDVKALSIYAKNLIQNGNEVLKGDIKEVSVVLSGANPGAFIDDISLLHSEDVGERDAIIYTGENLKHSEEGDQDMSEQTVQDVLETLNKDQMDAVGFLLGTVVENLRTQEDNDDDNDKEMEHSDMSRNVFENHENETVTELTHAEFTSIVDTAKRTNGSMREAFLEHSNEYGIKDIDVLFPEAKTIQNIPDFVSRDMGWVDKVMGKTRHTPFSRIKSVLADVTEDEARARGYVKAGKKVDEVFKLMKRTTSPTTIYKKQKLDRDDIIDITDLDVVVFLKSEMRMMLNEEISRAVLVGDGRSSGSPDKINEDNIRPIWTDDDLYVVRSSYTPDEGDENVVDLEDAVLRARSEYKGTKTPTMFAAPETVTNLMLQRDKDGRRLYKTEDELAAALRVSEIVEVPVFEGLTRDVKNKTHTLKAIILDISDYTIGADKGGDISFFDDFDIDYNQQKYLMETRISGCLTKPKSAMVIEMVKDKSGVGSSSDSH